MINDFNSAEIKIFSITEINKLVKELLQDNFPSIWVKGEISNFIEASSGHWYFSLKDNKAQVRCTMFRGKNNEVKWIPKNGDLIEAQCNIGLYEQRGDYQLNVSSLQQAGLGKLFEEFNQLKQKLNTEGLFDEKYKKTLPPHPRSIGVITSPDASVLRDVITTLKRRNKSLEIIIYPTPVQGKLAPQGIINAIKVANQRNEVEVAIICRGGGSIEDLWSFNDELVAREIFSSRLPIISAVGHQTDITISDFVADLRAPTPTAAAEIISTSYEELLGNFEFFKSKLLDLIQNRIEQSIQMVDFLEKGLVSPLQKIASQLDLVSALRSRMGVAISSQLEKYQEQIKSYKQNLSHLNPNEILSRGYSIILNQNKKIINNTSAMNVSDKIKIKFYEGNAEASITKINQDKES
ncbi:exodeoxyribonuclease VII large subunit [Methylophilaceae bacterium]|jgi:exodeoxyribonuclease VII large subunit|nr:exodeoxyribonuclease VII large subunit [Methylophilaceae bacterium]|tara:strand:- start:683 stop:1906 length:1224 start_codon:yes stop_codon:yes gene_type:complete